MIQAKATQLFPKKKTIPLNQIMLVFCRVLFVLFHIASDCTHHRPVATDHKVAGFR